MDKNTTILAFVARMSRQTLTAAIALAFSGAAVAQENMTSPPPPLEFPSEAGPGALRLDMALVREAIEAIVDRFLAANSADVHWAPGERPTECGQSCFGRPSMTAEDHRTSPNLRRAHLNAWVNLRAGPRSVSYPLDVYFTCAPPPPELLDADPERAPDDLVLVVSAKVGPPTIGDPEFLETLGNYLTAGLLTRLIIEPHLRAPSVQNQRLEHYPSCRSVGVTLAPDPRDDSVRYDAPYQSNLLQFRNLPQDRVKVEFLRIVRHALPAHVSLDNGGPGDPAAGPQEDPATGQFQVFLNGEAHTFPPEGLTLPVGGAAPINFCTTMDITGWNSLQILFVNGLGGAAWSQLPRAGGFGQGAIRTLTTGQTILVPGPSTQPDPTTGPAPPGPARPAPTVTALREFELTYRVTFIPALTFVAEPAQPIGPLPPGPAGILSGTSPPTATAVLDASPAEPCQEI